MNYTDAINPQHYEAVRAAIVKAVPEIMELKFGCEVHRYNHIEEKRVWKDGLLRMEHIHDGIKEVICGHFSEETALVRIDDKLGRAGAWMPFEVPRYLERDWKIIGRPIRLADVILAVHIRNGVEEVTTFRDKDFYNSRWNLRQDDLSQQSPQCIEFLHSLLCEIQ